MSGVEAVSLAALSSGETGVIQDLSGGRGFINRLAAMGFTPGAEVTILTDLNQHVGNWSGKTIEKKTGTFSFEELK